MNGMDRPKRFVCCNCGEEFPPGTVIVATLWICTATCYLAWFEKHFGRPLRSLVPKESVQHGI